MSDWFDTVIAYERKRINAAPQYYNAARFDPGGIEVEQAVTWNAFPKELLRRYGRDRALVLADSLWPYEHYHGGFMLDPSNAAGLSGILYRPQEEYCEWHVLRDPNTDKIQRITFTSEPPEYWQALFGFVPGDKPFRSASFPGDPKLLVELYRVLVDPSVELADLIAVTDIKDAHGMVITAKGQYHIYNKWNTTHGAAHLQSPPNSLRAEVLLGGDGAVLRLNPQRRLLVEPEALICYAAYGGVNRNSDPTIGATVNALARLGAYVTLRNPVGLYMDHIDTSGWQAPGGADVSEFVRIVRGTPGMIERLVIEAPPGRKLSVGDLTIAGVPVRFGGQVAECITVKLVGVANILKPPVSSPPLGYQARGYIDPSFPRDARITAHPSSPLPTGTIEAYVDQGTAPGGVTVKSPKGRGRMRAPAQKAAGTRRRARLGRGMRGEVP
jgi:hypothetical protein